MAKKNKRTRPSRIDVAHAHRAANPEALALFAAAAGDTSKLRHQSRAKPWSLQAGIPTPNGREQWVVDVWSTLTRMDYFNGKASGLYLKRPPVTSAPMACPGLDLEHLAPDNLGGDA